MILADSSVWIQHLRRGAPEFAQALEQRAICTHSVVIGELAAGQLPRRARFLADLKKTIRATAGTQAECLDFLEKEKLYGRGLSWNDIQLLVAARLSNARLWSFDTRLIAAAKTLGIPHL